MKHIISFLLCLQTLVLYAQHNVVPATEGFEIVGAVKNKLKFTIEDILKFKQEILGDLVLKNKRGEVKGSAKQLKGVLLTSFIDSAGILTEKPKDNSELAIILTASDNYINIYSWNELYNTEIGNHVYIITQMDGKPIDQIDDRILVISLSDINTARRHLKGLAKIEVRKIK